MVGIREKLGQTIGLTGAIAAIIFFIKSPSFPTPDMIVVFMIFVFMIFKQALVMLARFGPFILILLVYESFRSLADQLNTHVDYNLSPNADKFLFGNLPTVDLQNWLWHGTVRWYDYALYLPYLLHFMLPIGLGILVWKKRVEHYWRVVSTYVVSAFMAFFTFLALPTAPPWMASQQHVITHIHRISSDIWFNLGLKDFPSFYKEITPNPVAAVPSLHAAWSVIFCIIIFKLFGRRWGILSLIYPLAIVFGTVYMGEHYAFDAIIGGLYAVIAYLITPRILKWLARPVRRILKSSPKFRALVVE